jgi:hypothetical protein
LVAPARSLPLLLAVALLLGCGSSRPKGVTFHSAGGHFTVTQVEAAFAAQGIQLRLAHEQLPGFEVLHAGRRHLITVLVGLSAGQAVPVGYVAGGDRTRRNGNVHVSFDSSTAQAVGTALARLH